MRKTKKKTTMTKNEKKKINIRWITVLEVIGILFFIYLVLLARIEISDTAKSCIEHPFQFGVGLMDKQYNTPITLTGSLIGEGVSGRYTITSEYVLIEQPPQRLPTFRFNLSEIKNYSDSSID